MKILLVFNENPDNPPETHQKRPYNKSSKKQFLTEADKEKIRNSCQVCYMQFTSRQNAELRGIFARKQRKFNRSICCFVGKLKITCTKCQMSVHLGCYGMGTPFSTIKTEDMHVRNEFLCDVCSIKAEKFVIYYNLYVPLIYSFRNARSALIPMSSAKRTKPCTLTKRTRRAWSTCSAGCSPPISASQTGPSSEWST